MSGGHCSMAAITSIDAGKCREQQFNWVFYSFTSETVENFLGNSKCKKFKVAVATNIYVICCIEEVKMVKNNNKS